jgi:hypothetical protein
MSAATNLLATAARGAEQLIAEVRSLQLSGPRAGVAARAAAATTAPVLAALALPTDDLWWVASAHFL